jgi:hypothetical protein
VRICNGSLSSWKATEKVTTATDKQTNNDPREKEGSLLQKGKEQLPKSQGIKGVHSPQNLPEIS